MRLFFERSEPLSLAEIAALTGAVLADPSLAERQIEGLAVLDAAGPRHLTFLDGPKYLPQLEACRAGACFGPHVTIGRSCSIGPNVTIQCSLIGNNVIVHPGCRIGQDGYSYVPGPGGHIKNPQIGRVIVQNDVEIGANTTIDRGGLG